MRTGKQTPIPTLIACQNGSKGAEACTIFLRAQLQSLIHRTKLDDKRFDRYSKSYDKNFKRCFSETALEQKKKGNIKQINFYDQWGDYEFLPRSNFTQPSGPSHTT